MTVLNTADKIFAGNATASAVYLGANKVWPSLPPPQQVAGLLFWLDASQLTGAVGSSVTSWPDLSGNGHTCTAIETPPTLEASPNGKPWVQFGQSGMTIAGMGPVLAALTGFTFVMMSWPTNVDSSPIILSAPVDAAWQWLIEENPSVTFIGVPYGTYRGYNAAPVMNTWNLMEATGDHATTRLWMETNEITSYSAYGPGSPDWSASPPLGNDVLLCTYYEGYTGASLDWQGQMAEMLIYDHALTDADRATLESYLKRKWAGPVVTSVNPDVGDPAGNTFVTLTGSGLTGILGVDFGQSGVSMGIQNITDTTVTGYAPYGSSGPCDLLVYPPDYPTDPVVRISGVFSYS